MSERPVIAVAHYGSMKPFSRAQREQVEAVADVVSWEPITDFSTDDAKAALAKATMLLCHWGSPSVTDDVLADAPNLCRIAYGAGTVKELVSEAICDRLVVTLANTANAIPTAEFAAAMVILANKNTFLNRELSRDLSIFEDLPAMATPGNYQRTIGIVGASNVGRHVIRLLGNYDLNLIVSDPFLSTEEAADLGVEKVELSDLLTRSDVVTLHAPATPSTEGMIGSEQLALLRDGVTLINTARGVLVDWDALETELMSGRISAILDVTDPHEPVSPDWPPLAKPNVFVTPHVAGSQGTEVYRMSQLAVDEIIRFAEGEQPLHQVHAKDWDRIA